MSYNILMIVNPKAGKAKISKLTPEIIRNLQKQNYKVITRYTGKDKNAKNIVKDYYEPYDIVLVCGGDGTLNEVVQGLYERNKKILRTICHSNNSFTFINNVCFTRQFL